MSRTPILFFLIDGIGDVGSPTPLDTANTPTLDLLAKLGVNGLMDAVEPGLACGTDTAHLSLFGYDPRKYYRGRGAFESLGAGLDMNLGDVAFKCNFAVWDEKTNLVKSRRADRSFEKEGPILCSVLDSMPIPGFPDHSVAVKYATEHRCGVRLRGPGLSDEIAGTDPLRDGLPLIKSTPLPMPVSGKEKTSETVSDTDEAVLTAKLVNTVSDVFHKALEAHPINQERVLQGKPPANIVLLRGPGVRLDVPTFEEKHGLKPFVIAPTAIVKGIAITLGMPVLQVKGASGDYFTDLGAKADAAAEHIVRGGCDFGFVHVKAVDDTGHDGNAVKKVEWIEKCDVMVKRAIERVFQLLDEQDKDKDIPSNKRELIVVVTADHSTPVWRGDHSCEPVPFTVAKLCGGFEGVWSADEVCSFSEVKVGKLGRFLGSGVMPMLIELSLS